MARPATSNFQLNLGEPSTSKLGWLGHGRARYTPNLAITRDPSLRIRQAVRDNNVALLDRLQHKYELRNADKARMTSLSWAAVEGNLEVFEWLLMDYGHDDQELSRDNESNSILHILASMPCPPTAYARHPVLPPRQETRPTEVIFDIALKMAELYIYCFPFLNNWCNSAGKTPLHLAAQLGHLPMTQFLIDSSADVDLTDTQGNTPLHYASAYGHVDVIKALLEAGCHVNGRNAEGFTAAEFAFTERVFVELESTARAVAEGRKRQKQDDRDQQQYHSRHGGQGQGNGRLRSGSVSTSGSGITSNAGSGSASAHGSNLNSGKAYSNSPGRNRRSWAISSGSPNLVDRLQYFDAYEASTSGSNSNRGTSPNPTSNQYSNPNSLATRIGTPPTIIRRGSEGATDRDRNRSFSQLLANAPPVPPLPAHAQLPMNPPRPPHRSPSLPVQPVVYRPMALAPPLTDQRGQDGQGSAGMRRANSAQVGTAGEASIDYSRR